MIRTFHCKNCGGAGHIENEVCSVCQGVPIMVVPCAPVYMIEKGGVEKNYE